MQNNGISRVNSRIIITFFVFLSSLITFALFLSLPLRLSPQKLFPLIIHFKSKLYQELQLRLLSVGIDKRVNKQYWYILRGL